MEELLNGIKDLFSFGKKANEGTVASPEVDQLSGVDGMISGKAAKPDDSGNFLASLIKIIGI